MRKHVLCDQHLIDRSLILTAARVKSQYFARRHLKGFNGFVNDDQNRKLCGLPPSRQQRTMLKALGGLGSESSLHSVSTRQLPLLSVL